VEKLAYYERHGFSRGLAVKYAKHLRGTVLDVGCGTGGFGRLCPWLEVYGIDNDIGALKIASQYETTTLADVSTGELPYADESFDSVLCKDVLEHLAEPWLLVSEVKRVLRDGGTVVASTVQARPKRVWADYTHIRGFTPTALRLMFEDAGFHVGGVTPMGGVPLSERLRFVHLLPYLLRVPPFSGFWASSWELVATKTS
jgi:2-polyprenyl-3-methyl-5-hydroxy-6-metoxy-1,4-benzoquinol methylase